ncbi:MAG: MmcB family DNA repair protein [Methylocella sp.]
MPRLGHAGRRRCRIYSRHLTSRANQSSISRNVRTKSIPPMECPGHSSLIDITLTRGREGYPVFSIPATVPIVTMPEDAGLVLADAFGESLLREAPEHRIAAACGVCLLSACMTIGSRPIGIKRAYL